MTEEIPVLRPWRKVLQSFGQTSEPYISAWVVSAVDGESVIDVGCGAGLPAATLRASWTSTPAWARLQRPPSQLVGVDFSPRAVEYARRYGSFDEVRHAHANTLPAADSEFETAVSIENVEHLWGPDVSRALSELVRVASRQVIVTTPWPWDVGNVGWLDHEIAEARSDRVVLGHEEFLMLVGALHKSTVTPEQMNAAGFTCVTPGGVTGPSAIYVGEPDEIDLSALGLVSAALDPAANAAGDDLRREYLDVLEAVRSWSYSLSKAPPRVALSRRTRAAGMATWYAVGSVVQRVDRRFRVGHK